MDHGTYNILLFMHIVHLLSNTIEATIMTGAGSGKNVFIPQFPMITNDYPFSFKRMQFPVKAAFAITFNKSAGSNIKNICHEKDIKFSLCVFARWTKNIEYCQVLNS